MAKDTNRIIDETVGAFKRLKDEVKAYKDELATLTVGTKEWNDTTEKLRNVQKQVDAINKSAKGTLVDYNNAQQNSINYLKERVKLLNQERNAMDMDSKEYKNATKELKQLNDKLREAGTSAGDWKANVGNYAGSIKDAFTDLGSAANGLSGNIGLLNTSMLKLAANPIGAAILAITTAIGALAKGIKSSEDNTNRWNAVLSPVKALLTMIERACQAAADKFLTFAENMRKSETAGNVFKGVLTAVMTVINTVVSRIQGIAEGIRGVMDDLKPYAEKLKEWANKLKESLEPVTDFVGRIYDSIKDKLNPVIDWIVEKYNELAKTNLGKILGLDVIQRVKASFGLAKEQVAGVVDEVEELTHSYDRIAKMEAALQRQRRASATEQARLQNEIADAQERYQEAMNNKDWAEAQKALNEIGEKNKKLVAERVALASAEYELIKAKNSLSDSTTQALDAETAAYTALIQAKGEESELNRTLLRQQRQLNNSRESDEAKQKAEAFKDVLEKLNEQLSQLIYQYQAYVSNIQLPKMPEGKDITKDSINEYYDNVKVAIQGEYDAYVAMQEGKTKLLEEFVQREKEAGNDVSKQELELANLREEKALGYAKAHKKMIKEMEDNEKSRVKSQKALLASELLTYQNLFDGVSQLFEKNTVAYKATATAKALIATFLAGAQALEQTPGGLIARIAAMTGVIAAGIANVMQIWKVNPKGESSVPSAAVSSAPTVAEPVMVESEPYVYTRTAQTFEEEDQLNQPLWVSVTDINNVQNRVKVVEDESSW